ncbi:MAG: carbohydrate kinase family protein [Spirochaetota bacterium]
MIACIGEALIDFIPATTHDGVQAYIPSPGGSPYNTAITCGRLEHPTYFLSRLSGDFFGRDLRTSLERNRVNISYVASGEEPTTLAFVRKNSAGDAEYAFFANDSADRLITIDDLPGTLPEGLHCIECGSISMQMEPGASALEHYISKHAQDVVVAYDPNVRPSLLDDEQAHRKRVLRVMGMSGIVKVSDVDLEWLFPDKGLEAAAAAILDLGTPLVVVTAGAEGATGYTEHTSLHVPAGTPEGGIKDTVGAGDSFHGALLTWLDRNGLMSRERLAALDSETLKKALSFAAGVAAITCSRSGAEPPYASEIVFS